MPITPEGSLLNARPRNAGEIPVYHPASYIRTLLAEGEVKFGRALMLGTDPNTQGKMYDGAGGTFIGVASASTSASDLDNEKYADKDVLGVVDQAYVVVYVEEAVTPSDPVRIRHTDDTGVYAGDFATSADAGKTALLTGARFRGETTGAGLVILELMPVFSTTDDV